MKKVLLLLLFLAINSFLFAQKYYTVNEIPNPKIAGQDYFVSNPDDILSNVDSLNRMLVRLEKDTKVEFAIVAVKDFNQNQEDFEFAKALFDEWGIGKAGANNGLLLVIATDRRAYRFISGSGVEGLLPDIVLKQYGERILVPAFKEQLYDEGMYSLIYTIHERLLDPTNIIEVQQFATQTKQKQTNWLIALASAAGIIALFVFLFKYFKKLAPDPKLVKNKGVNDFEKTFATGCAILFFICFISVFIILFTESFDIFKSLSFSDMPIILYVILAIALFFRYISHISTLRKLHNDDQNFFRAVNSFHAKNWWLIIFSPIILFVLISQTIKSYRAIKRFTPILDSQNKPMVRLDRDINIEGKPYLSPGQRKEEVIKAYDYDVWESEDKKEHVIKVWPAEEYNDFTECPACNFRTYKLNKRDTIVAATYSHDGKAKLVNECSFCKHVEFIKWIVLPMLTESKSSSSSSSSGGGSSSSSSSGSFGGGSSSGGGAGGRW